MQIWDNNKEESVVDHLTAGWEIINVGKNGFVIVKQAKTESNFNSDGFKSYITRLEDFLHLVINDDQARYSINFNDRTYSDASLSRVAESSMEGACVFALTLKE